MQVTIDSELMDEIVSFVGEQPCKKSYTLYTKLLIAARNAAERRAVEVVETAAPSGGEVVMPGSCLVLEEKGAAGSKKKGGK